MYSAEELRDLVALGKSRRATQATDINASSSRSHAVLRITIHHQGEPEEGFGRAIEGEEGTPLGGVVLSAIGRLTLVDCAGRWVGNQGL